MSVSKLKNGLRVEEKLVVPQLTAAPSSPEEGEIYYDTTLDKLRVYQNAGWSTVDGTAAASLDAA